MIQAHLDNAARALNPVCTAWRAIADEWDLLSTGTNHGRGVSRVATEIGDLVLRLGRLAYTNPEWTPASGDSLPRDPAGLAPAVGDLRAVLTATHHATDTLTRIAATDDRCVRRSRRRQQALHPHPPAPRRLRHPPPLRHSTALTRNRPARQLPPRRPDLHRRHRSLRRPRPLRRDSIPRAGRCPQLCHGQCTKSRSAWTPRAPESSRPARAGRAVRRIGSARPPGGKGAQPPTQRAVTPSPGGCHRQRGTRPAR